MRGAQLDDEARFDRQYQFVSAAALGLEWFERTVLWPLEPEERREFRKGLLMKVAAVIDEELRGPAFVEFLRGCAGRHRKGAASRRPPREADETGGSTRRLEAALRAFAKLGHEQGESAGDGTAQRPCSQADGAAES